MLWLWCRLAAVALIGPLAWELPYAVGMALKSKKKKKKKKKLQELRKDDFAKVFRKRLGLWHSRNESD